MFEGEGFAGLVVERDGAVRGRLRGRARAGWGSRAGGRGPGTQDDGVGRALMEAAVARSRERGRRQGSDLFRYRSLALHGVAWSVREPLSVVRGPVPAVAVAGVDTRPADAADVEACATLCARRLRPRPQRRVARDAIAAGTATIAERAGSVTWGKRVRVRLARRGHGQRGRHGPARLAEEHCIELGVLVPSGNAELLGWCLDHGLRMVSSQGKRRSASTTSPRGVAAVEDCTRRRARRGRPRAR